MGIDYLQLEARIQAYLRYAASHRRETERIGSFLATFTPSSENFYLNYAIPDDGATPSWEDVAGLITAYEKRARRPRLEYVSRLAPSVEGVLLEAGFVEEGKMPLMVCVPGAEAEMAMPPGIEFVVPHTDADLLDTITVQNAAYGGDPPDSSAVSGLRASIEDGTIVVLARVTETGEPVGGGVCTIPYDDLTEVAGVGVSEKFRRRGVAGALTARLVEEAFRAGVTLAFLMAAGEAEARIYARAGFSQVGDVLHISRLLAANGC